MARKTLQDREDDLKLVAKRIDKTAREWGKLTPDQFRDKKNDIIGFMALEAANLRTILDLTKGVM